MSGQPIDDRWGLLLPFKPGYMPGSKCRAAGAINVDEISRCILGSFLQLLLAAGSPDAEVRFENFNKAKSFPVGMSEQALWLAEAEF